MADLKKKARGAKVQVSLPGLAAGDPGLTLQKDAWHEFFQRHGFVEDGHASDQDCRFTRTL
jgi:hypothetical protein